MKPDDVFCNPELFRMNNRHDIKLLEIDEWRDGVLRVQYWLNDGGFETTPTMTGDAEITLRSASHDAYMGLSGVINIYRGTQFTNEKRTIAGVKKFIQARKMNTFDSSPFHALILYELFHKITMEELGLTTVVVLHEPVLIQGPNLKKFQKILCIAKSYPPLLCTCEGSSSASNREFGENTAFAVVS